MRANSFAQRLLDWWVIHGRHDLPWQVERTAYRVWVSEIMLQQTRVATVIPYFERFMASFPDLEALAAADLDDVLALWSGLGYYARARNLHAAARICVGQHGGTLPDKPALLRELPGIGGSTANAIVAQALDRRAPILDGNVKRVLARHAGIEGWPGRSAITRELWQQAEARTPDEQARDYTQAIMDLGATVCTPRNPACSDCPVATDCRARQEDRVSVLPTKKPKRSRPRRAVVLVLIHNEDGELLLQRRAPTGIWGGLWSLPPIDELPLENTGPTCQQIEHHFTHFILDIEVRIADLKQFSDVADDDQLQWMRPEQALRAGLPRPIRQIIESTTTPS
ncbi:A/G-specific adenine glycosylase [Wenzhouxiangella sp. AB-CW3]|uniref:A/G-specific adenine glycosylase n=1 Tax=Wenzhouxiangella sp. AB-CW3 TaxID=2771012 RepID=UPI00168B89D0|nr:A/G-specific adenine glycosylase [Wenzhouxiangella sp. AB-CW3]QOC21439.1 A/G-specific adenine glycosylase [Wenzhouxiangella sp. AB-CW3]